VRLHLRSDVPLGGYVSGGTDSGILATLASRSLGKEFMGFTGRFPLGPEYDESPYARELAAWAGFPLLESEMTAGDFQASIEDVIYHLDQPVAGPGSFPQYHVSKLASAHRKVVLGGQGGDEIFGGYARYLLAYFEQCIKAAIDGTTGSGRFIVTYESIIPNLGALRRYKPLIREFWREGLFEEMDRRYFRLINRAGNLNGEIRTEVLGEYSPFETFLSIFHGGNVSNESYFDRMTHFDFKTLLPALLQVEDRMSMAHGLESRVPFLDHPLVELAATIPSDTKFKDGKLKRVLLEAAGDCLPSSILKRQDKMGFPVPLNEWLEGELKDFVHDIFSSRAAAQRSYFDTGAILRNLDAEPQFGRKVWGLLSLEIWHRRFHDRQAEFRTLPDKEISA
jgi:asparagine synthase (glutamine-hydrolysing)